MQLVLIGFRIGDVGQTVRQTTHRHGLALVHFVEANLQKRLKKKKKIIFRAYFLSL